MRCSNCQKELSENAYFCPDCGTKVSREETSEQMPDPTVSVSPSISPAVETPFVPASFDARPKSAASLFSAPKPVPEYYPPLPPLQVYDESDYYHIDATETPDFEAIRGISIILIVLSVFTFVGVLFPMPLAIVSLVKACNGVGERNPTIAKQSHDLCRILIIISAIAVVTLYIAWAVYFSARKQMYI